MFQKPGTLLLNGQKLVVSHASEPLRTLEVECIIVPSAKKLKDIFLSVEAPLGEMQIAASLLNDPMGIIGEAVDISMLPKIRRTNCGIEMWRSDLDWRLSNARGKPFKCSLPITGHLNDDFSVTVTVHEDSVQIRAKFDRCLEQGAHFGEEAIRVEVKAPANYAVAQPEKV